MMVNTSNANIYIYVTIYIYIFNKNRGYGEKKKEEDNVTMADQCYDATASPLLSIAHCSFKTMKAKQT